MLCAVHETNHVLCGLFALSFEVFHYELALLEKRAWARSKAQINITRFLDKEKLPVFHTVLLR